MKFIHHSEQFIRSMMQAHIIDIMWFREECETHNSGMGNDMKALLWLSWCIRNPQVVVE